MLVVAARKLSNPMFLFIPVVADDGLPHPFDSQSGTIKFVDSKNGLNPDQVQTLLSTAAALWNE